MKNSCLVGLILMATVLLALAMMLQRCLVTEEAGLDLEATATLSVVTPGLDDQAITPEPMLVLRAYAERIEGLYLGAVHPILIDQGEIRSLAALNDSLGVLAYDEAQQAAWLYQVDPVTYAVQHTMPLYEEGYPRPGGVTADADTLWVSLAEPAPGGDSLILAIDRATAEVRQRTVVTDTLRTIVMAGEGRLFGMDEAGQWFYEWQSGQLVRQEPNATGMVYQDCEAIRHSLVCTGLDQVTGPVLDVIDPASLSLLVRYDGTTRTADGEWVIGNALTFDGTRFLFAPQGGELPLIWVYTLDDRSVAEFVPSTWSLE